MDTKILSYNITDVRFVLEPNLEDVHYKLEELVVK